MNATPRPWKVGYRNEADNALVITEDVESISKAIPICDVRPQPHYHDTQAANAALIVQAVNSYDAMREALEQAATMINSEYCTHDGRCGNKPECAAQFCYAALALAGKE